MLGFKKRKQNFIKSIASEIISQLESQRGWREFLPPISHEGNIYFFTKDGIIYRMAKDYHGLEVIYKIPM